MFADERSLPRLYENEPRKGFVLLIPWMLLGIIWLGLSTGLNQTTVNFYYSLLVAGSVSLVFITLIDRKLTLDLSELKLLPFVIFLGIALAGVFLAFASVRLLTDGTLQFNEFQPAQFGNFLALTVLIVAPVETLVFQYIIPKISTMTLKTANLAILGGVAAQGTFAGFHYFAYTQDIAAMGFAFLLGLGFYALVKTSPVWGIGAAIGAHSGWNISVALLSDGGINEILAHVGQ